MIRKKLLIGLCSALGVGVIASIIGIGYTINKPTMRYNSYTATPLSSSTSDLIQAYFSSAVDGSKFLYLASFTHTTPLTNALNITKEENPAIHNYLGKTGFLLIDDKYGLPIFNDNGIGLKNTNQPIWSTNVASVQFRVDLGSFITGIAIGEFLNEYQSYFLNDNKLTWGIYGGMPYSSVTSYMGGFQKGINWFNKNIVPKKNGYKEIEQVFINNELNGNFSNGFGINDGDDLINRFLDKGVDVIIPIAGTQIGRAARLVRQRNARTIVIGVDSACELDTTINIDLSTPINPNSTDPLLNKIIQFSSVKNLNIAANKITQLINDPKLFNPNDKSWSNIGGLGYCSLGNIDNDCVGISEDGKKYFISALKNVNSQIKTYDDAVNFLNLEFDKLDTDKTYIYGNKTLSYADILNSGYEMLPLPTNEDNKQSYEIKLESWYKKIYQNDSLAIENKSQNINSILNWVQQHEATILERSNFSLQGKLTKQSWENNNGVIKIVFQSSTSILFDKSFLESCYNGLVSYWKSQDVSIPLPPGQK